MALDPSIHIKAVASELFGQPTSKTRKEWRFGTHGSLSIDLAKATWYSHEDGAGGGVLDLIVREKGGNRRDAVTWMSEHLGIELNGEYEPSWPRPHGSAITIDYVYRDVNGDPLYRVVREEPKRFHQESWQGASWSRTKGCMEGVELVPYRLDEWSAEISAVVWVVEGEKDADRLHSLGFMATCNPGGAGKWPDSFAQWFAGRDVVAIPDNDEPGRKHVRQVGRALQRVVTRFRILELPDLPDKGDVSDWLDAGHSVVELEELLARTKAHDDQPTLKLAKAFIAGFVPPEYIIEGIIQRGRLYCLTALTNHGKTAVGLCLAVCKALGKAINGHLVERGNVIYFTAENPDDTRARMMLMADKMAIDLDNLQLWFIDKGFDLTLWADAIEHQVKEIGGVSSVYVDTSAAFHAACGFDDENNNVQALQFATKLRKLTELPGHPAIISLTHPVKGAIKDNLLPRGGGAFLNEIDGNLNLWSEGDRETTELSWSGKLRGPSFDPIMFALERGTCDALVDKKGRKIPSVWASPCDAGKAEEAERRSLGDQNALMRSCLLLKTASLADHAIAMGWIFSNGEPARSRVQRAFQALADDGLARKLRGNRWGLTAKGIKEAEKC